MRENWWKSLYAQVLIAIAAGIVLGIVNPSFAAQLKPLGEAFIALVKMVIGPVIFLTVVVGMAKMGDLRHVGRIGVKALLYFELMTSVALVLGLIIVNVMKPGAGMHIDPATLDPAAIAEYQQKAAASGVVGFLTDIIPKTFLSAFTDGNLLQVLLIALLFGVALTRSGATGRKVLDGLEQLGAVFFGIVNLIMRFAPLGALGAMAFTVGKYGVATLLSLGWLLLSVYVTCALFVLVVLAIVAYLSGFSLWKFLRHIRAELLLVLGTSSSESALPRLIERLEELGCDRGAVGLIVPTGYSFNLDGTCIYLTMAAVFIAQATDVPLGLGDQLVLLGVLLLTSKGAAGVTGSGFITLAATLAALHGKVPVAGVALILGVDRFMSEARAITNIIGNGVATLVVSRWEGLRDDEKMRAALDAGSTAA
ncbi:MAG TPA: C4-dicarboxylate transporter DctA [Arenimonas sp.]|uniref:C4-dicarboxylate transporter DctA n=1 Tax=Arenimonas sp. TaxID=1872635 RepID=UPI002C7237D7|nr:C4-dicarboxylate transporter DctA [Arenimonas sp.]HMB56921.1 C4-dicarboxylate transporter DctA [Arenimonas sp.]